MQQQHVQDRWMLFKLSLAKQGYRLKPSTKVLKQYKPYVNPGMESGLSPRIQVWPQELGIDQLHVRLLNNHRAGRAT